MINFEDIKAGNILIEILHKVYYNIYVIKCITNGNIFLICLNGNFNMHEIVLREDQLLTETYDVHKFYQWTN